MMSFQRIARQTLSHLMRSSSALYLKRDADYLRTGEMTATGHCLSSQTSIKRNECKRWRPEVSWGSTQRDTYSLDPGRCEVKGRDPGNGRLKWRPHEGMSDDWEADRWVKVAQRHLLHAEAMIWTKVYSSTDVYVHPIHRLIFAKLLFSKKQGPWTEFFEQLKTSDFKADFQPETDLGAMVYFWSLKNHDCSYCTFV